MKPRLPQETGVRDEALRAPDIPSLLAAQCAMMSLHAVADFPFPIVLLATLLIVPGVVIGRTRQPQLYRRVWMVVSSIFIASMLVAHFFLDQASHIVLVGICLFLTVHRWYTPRGIREHLEIWCLAALLMMIGALKGSGIVSLALILGWSLSSLFLFGTLGSIASRRDLPGGSPQRAPHSERTLRGLLPLYLLIGAACYLVAPRLAGPGTSVTQAEAGPSVDRFTVQSGFSETVNFRSMTNIKEGTGIAFRIMNPPRHVNPSQLRFRVTTLDRFDGWEWRRAAEEDGQPIEILPPDGLIPSLAMENEAPSAGQTDWFSIRIMDLPANLLPLPETAVAFGGIPRDARLLLDPNGRVRVRRPRPLDEYQVLCNRYPKNPEDYPLRRGAVLPCHREVPAGIAAAAHAMAREILSGKGSLPTMERARLVMIHLKRRGVYTLDMEGMREGPDATNAFLRGNMTGNCELFATAFAMIVRSEGIPARIVTGFSGGDFARDAVPESPNDILVHHRDAHAWVEAWSPAAGWVAFDPTPSTLVAATTDLTAASQWTRAVQQGSHTVSSTVEGYGQASQRRFLQSASRAVWSALADWEHGALPRAAERFATNMGEPPVRALAIALVVLNATALALAWWSRRRRSRREIDGSSAVYTHPAPDLLREILSVLGGSTARRPRALSPRELILASGSAYPRELVEELAWLYNTWRFDGQLTERREQIRTLLDRLRALRNNR